MYWTGTVPVLLCIITVPIVTFCNCTVLYCFVLYRVVQYCIYCTDTYPSCTDTCPYCTDTYRYCYEYIPDRYLSHRYRYWTVTYCTGTDPL